MRLTGLSYTAVDKWRGKFGKEGEHGSGAGLRIYAPEFVRRWNDARGADANARQVDEFDQRWKAARAEKAELELRELRGELLTLEHHEDDTRDLCETVRSGIEDICPGCQEIMRAKLEEQARRWGLESVNGHSGEGSTSQRKATSEG